MSSSKPSTTNRPFWHILVLTLVLCAVLLALAWPSVNASRRSLSYRLSDHAGQVSAAEAALDYQLAYRLYRSNAAAAVGLAAAQETDGEYAKALTTLSRAGEGRDVTRYRLRADLELGYGDDAVAQASQMVSLQADGDDMVLAALAFDLKDRKDRIPLTMGLVGSPEAAGRITRASADKLALAQELYASGLPKSSSTLLVKLSSSLPRSLLMGQILYNEHSKASLATAVDYYTAAIAIDPTNQAARSGLIRCLTDLDRSAEATAQEALLNKLRSGKL